MTKKYNKPQPGNNEPSPNRILRIMLVLIIYARVSTMAQRSKYSEHQQTAILKQEAMAMGWPEELIVIINADLGVSGQKGIEEREGMQEMRTLMVTGFNGIRVGTVYVMMADRLFRDLTHIHFNRFADLCKAHDVHILTQKRHYDFNHPTLGKGDLDDYRSEMKAAASYIEHVVGRMHPAKDEIGRAGKWDGRQIIAGYMVDMRALLLDETGNTEGTANPDYRKYRVFKPYAEIVLRIRQRFVELDFNMNALKREVDARADLQFPPLEDVKDEIPEGFKVHRIGYKNRSPVTGWPVPSRNALENMLTNVTYIGHWEYSEVIVKYDNHEALMTEAEFMEVFNRLSETDFVGDPNPHYMPQRPYTRHKAEAAQSRQATYKGLIRSNDIPHKPGKHVTTNWNKKTKKRNYQFGKDQQDSRIWTMKCETVDAAVDGLVRERLQQTVMDDALWQQVRSETAQKVDRSDIKRLQQDLRAVKRQMTQLELQLDTLTNAELILKKQAAYTKAGLEKQRLEREIANREANADLKSQLPDVRAAVVHIVAEWDRVSPAHRRRLVELLADHIEMTKRSRLTMRVILHWLDGSSSVADLRNDGRGRSWKPEEVVKLCQMIDDNVDQPDILREFPDLCWRNLVDMYAKHNNGLRTQNYRGYKPYNQDTRWEDTTEYFVDQLELSSSSSHSTTTVTGQENQLAGPFDWYDLCHVRGGLAAIVANLPGAAPDVLAAAD